VNIAMFIVFRLMAGFGCYATAAIVPLMMSEIVPPRYRGACVDVMGVGINIGYSLSGWLGYGFSFWEKGSGSQNAWRVPLALGVFFPMIFLVGIFFIPESPRWLCMKGREEEAETVLKRLHKNSGDPDGDFARAEFFQIREQIALDSQLDNSWYRLFTKPSYRKRAGLAMLTMFTTQTSGVLLITSKCIIDGQADLS
jgi:MFS family permease